MAGGAVGPSITDVGNHRPWPAIRQRRVHQSSPTRAATVPPTHRFGAHQYVHSVAAPLRSKKALLRGNLSHSESRRSEEKYLHPASGKRFVSVVLSSVILSLFAKVLCASEFGRRANEKCSRRPSGINSIHLEGPLSSFSNPFGPMTIRRWSVLFRSPLLVLGLSLVGGLLTPHRIVCSVHGR